MRRSTRKAVVNLSIFFTALLVILFVNRPRRDVKYEWNRIRYKTSATVLPEPRGVCPGIAFTTKPALVVARTMSDGDTSWLDSLGKRYHRCVYTVDGPHAESSNKLQVPANRGHEAMAYLTFIIDNYPVIPPAGAVFVHGARFSWHNDHSYYDNAALLAALNFSAATKEYGYHNLRCDWSVSMCLPSMPAQGSLEMSMQSMMDPWDARAASDAALPGALEALFGKNQRLRRTHAIRAQCCAQFIVTRSRIWSHTREEYVAIRQWLLDGMDGDDKHQNTGSVAPKDDKVAGRILSYVWHILFMEVKTEDGWAESEIDLDRLNAAACPRASDCYCKLYGRCNLKHCNAGSCHAQYFVPADLKLPDDWAIRHG